VIKGVAKEHSIVDIGKELQKYGLRVGENPAFGKVGKHAPGSYHYAGKAIDVTDWRPDVSPAFPGGKPISWKQRTGELSYRAKKSGLFTEALGPGDPGHGTHVHLALKDPAKVTPELLQWIATGRYKTADGKLTDVMPTLSQATSASQQSTAQQPVGDTYIFVGGNSKKKESGQDFLSSYIQESLMGSMPEFKAAFDPTALLTQAFSQTPNYMS
jgi:hypothetical protein